MQRLDHLALNEEGFVFDPITGDSYQVSLTGLTVLKALREGKTDLEIGLALTESHEVSLEDAQRDVSDFTASLRSNGIQ